MRTSDQKIEGKTNMFRIEERKNTRTGTKYLSVRKIAGKNEALRELKNRIPGKVKLYEEHLDILGPLDYSFLKKFVSEIRQPDKRENYLTKVEKIDSSSHNTRPYTFIYYEKFLVHPKTWEIAKKILEDIINEVTVEFGD